MTGDGNWTFLFRAACNDARRRRHRHARASRRDRAGARRRAAGAGAGHARARRSHRRGAGAGRNGFRACGSARCRGPERDVKWPVGWDPIVAGEMVAGRRLDAASPCTRLATRRTTSASGMRRRARSCAAIWSQRGNTVWIPASLRGDLIDYLASLRARPGARAGAAPAGAWPGDRRPREAVPAISEPPPAAGGAGRGRAAPRPVQLGAPSSTRSTSGWRESLLKLAHEGVRGASGEAGARRAAPVGHGDAWHIMDP